MQNATSLIKRAFKLLIMLVVAVWLVIGVSAGVYNNYHQRAECVKHEGLMKGLFWCPNGGMSDYGKNMLLGMLWPALFFITVEKHNQ